MKTFIKTLQQNKPCFQFLKEIFPKISNAKVKKGIFVGLQIYQILDNEDFKETVDELELAA